MSALRFNPFVPDKTADPHRFEGRKPELEMMVKALNQTRHGSPTHLMIIGERGIGKSSLLGYGEKLARDGIAENKLGFSFLTLPTDLAGVTTHQDITRRIGRRLKECLRPHRAAQDGLHQIFDFLSRWEALGVSYDRSEAELDPDEALDELIDQLVQVERTGKFQGVCILMDEADDPPVSARLSTWCKSLCERLEIQGSSKVMLALAGQDILRDKLNEDHESGLRLFRPVTLKTLAAEERVEAIEAGLEFGNETADQETTASEEAIRMLADLSDGYPHFLQHYCYTAFEHDSDGIIDVDDVSACRDRAISEIGEKFFRQRFVSQIGSEDYRRLLYFVAPRGAEDWTRKEVVEGSGISERVVDNALRSLTESGFLTKNPALKGVYRLQSNALAAWLQVIDGI